MVGELITLPLRLWLRSAQLVTRVALGASGRAVSLAGHAIQTVTPGGSNGATSHTPPGPAEDEPQPPVEDEPQPHVEEVRPHVEEKPWHLEEERPPAEPSELPSDPRRELVEDRVPGPEPRIERPPAPREEPAPPQTPTADAPSPAETPGVEEPVHVSEEPELVREEAEHGAEDGVGADVTVMEPWDGYAGMSAREVIGRIESASAAELAAVRLYESQHRGRQTVLVAVDRQLKTVNGSGRPN